jgi:hypothetical protein
MIQSKYAILSNKPVHRGDLGEFKEIIYKLPEWFVNWNKNKIIKVYGCSFAYLDSVNRAPVISTLYQNQFISVHSNIVNDDVQHLNSVYILDGYREVFPELPDSALLDEAKINEGFMMVCNNFYSPKIFNLTNSTLDFIKIYFKDATGNVIPLRTPYVEVPPEGSGSVHTDGIRQAVFKLEIELATLA